MTKYVNFFHRLVNDYGINEEKALLIIYVNFLGRSPELLAELQRRILARRAAA